MRFTNSKKAIAALTVTAVGLSAGVAFAAARSDGEGESLALAGSAQGVTVTAATGDADLFPGTTDGDVSFTLTNPNTYDVNFDTMTAGTIVSRDPVACPSSTVTVDGATGLSLAVGASATSGTLLIDDVVSLDADAPDGCQGASFDIVLSLRSSSAGGRGTPSG